MMRKVDEIKNDIESYLKKITDEAKLNINTLKAYKCDLSAFVTWLDTNKVKYVDTSTFCLYVDYLHDTAKLKKATIHRKSMTLKVFYVRSYGIELNLDSVDCGIEKPNPRVLTESEVSQLLSRAEAELDICERDFFRDICVRDIAILNIVYSIGIRVSELLNLAVTDLDIDTRIVTIKGKGLKKRNLYISSDYVLTKLKDWLKVRGNFQPTEDYLFVNKSGNKLSNLGGIYDKYRDLAGLSRKTSINNLRHAFVVSLLNNGVKIQDVQEVMGHAHMATTIVYVPAANDTKVLSVPDVRSLLNVDTKKM